MMYMGGKSRIRKEIARIISEIPGREVKNCERNCSRNFERERTLVSLFCGSCSVESRVTGFDKIICNDKHEYLIEMLKGVQSGYELPNKITEEEYKYIREHKDDDRCLSGFVGFGCSFGGKWFGGYARNKTNTNYAEQSKRSLLKDMESLKDATFCCMDYKDVELPEGCVVYADPPYNGTTGYGKEKFNTSDFWEYMRVISKNHIVFISEQSAPDDFIPIWEKPFTRTLDVNKENQFVVTEKLFVHKDSSYFLHNNQMDMVV